MRAVAKHGHHRARIGEEGQSQGVGYGVADDFVRQEQHGSLLIEAIENYEEAKREGTFSIQQPKAKKARTAGTSDDKMKEYLGRVLNQNQTVFRTWSAEMLRMLIFYADSKNMPLEVLNKITSKDKLLELVEYLWDVSIFSNRPDRVSCLQLNALLPKMRAAYETSGSRLEKINSHLREGFLDWRSIGHYQVTVVSPVGRPKQFEVECHTLGKEVLVGADVTQGDDTLETLIVKQNFSLASAYLQTTSDSYNISAFFPQLARQLRRSLSEECSVTSAVPGGSSSGRQEEGTSGQTALVANPGVAGQMGDGPPASEEANLAAAPAADDDLPPSPLVT